MVETTLNYLAPMDDRPYSADELAGFRRNPWAVRRERWRIWKLFHDNIGAMADDPVVAVPLAIVGGSYGAFVGARIADLRRS